MKLIAIFALIASLFSFGKKEPQILDGPGMEYVDSEYRTKYANCLPFEEMRGAPYFAIAYLGKGDEGKAKRTEYINLIFAELEQSEIDAVKHYDYEGDHWYLIIPKYRESVFVKYAGDKSVVSYEGDAFTVKCNNDVTVNTFDVTDIDYVLDVNADGVLENVNENIWDITKRDGIMKK